MRGPMKLTAENVSEDQVFLLNGFRVVGILANLASGGWLWINLNPFATGVEVEKEDAGKKILEVQQDAAAQRNLTD